MKRNVTLAIDEELVQKARAVASRCHTTMTELIREYLVRLVDTHDERSAAKDRVLQQMNQSELRVGEKTWTREELHERG